MNRARVYREAPGLWVAQLPGRTAPTVGATTHAGALDALASAFAADEYWRAQDPLADRPEGTPAPRPVRWWSPWQ